MSVGFHAALRSDAVVPGRKALIIGAGCIGLCTLLALRKMGLTEIHQTEPLELRRNKAQELGAIVHDPRKESNEDLMRASGGEGFDLVIECAGETDTPSQAVELCRRGGSVTLVSMPAQTSLPFPTLQVVRKELDVHGLYRYRNQYAAVTEMIADGLPVREIVSHTYPLEQAPEAFAFNAEHKDECVKIILEV
jgi:L-iditol 2-dehydrogenase